MLCTLLVLIFFSCFIPVILLSSSINPVYIFSSDYTSEGQTGHNYINHNIVNIINGNYNKQNI